jgi:photosystem II stability/assembly factor-like uncharacterized protein
MFKTTDSGDHWTTINTGLTASAIQTLAIDPYHPSTLYAGTMNGMFKSTDGGGNWSGLTIYNVPGVGDVRSLVFDPLKPSTLYAIVTYSVYKSTNSGDTWTWLGYNNVAAYFNVRSLVIDPLRPTTLYVATVSQGVFKSTNGGSNWTAFNTGLSNLNVTSLTINSRISPSVLYAGTNGNGLFAAQLSKDPQIFLPFASR